MFKSLNNHFAVECDQRGLVTAKGLPEHLIDTVLHDRCSAVVKSYPPLFKAVFVQIEYVVT